MGNFDKLKGFARKTVLGAAMLANQDSVLAQQPPAPQQSAERQKDPFQEALKLTNEADGALANLEKFDLGVLDKELELQTTSIEKVNISEVAEIVKQAEEMNMPENLPTDKKLAVDKLEGFLKQLEVIQGKLEFVSKDLDKALSQASENTKFNRQYAVAFSNHQDVGNFIDKSEDFKKLDKAQQQKLVDWKNNFEQKLKIFGSNYTEALKNLNPNRLAKDKSEQVLEKILPASLKINNLAAGIIRKLIELK